MEKIFLTSFLISYGLSYAWKRILLLMERYILDETPLLKGDMQNFPIPYN